MSKGGSNPKGGVKRGKEQLESHTSPSLSLFSSKKKRTKCNNNSPCASLALMLLFAHICYRQILSGKADGVSEAVVEHNKL